MSIALRRPMIDRLRKYKSGRGKVSRLGAPSGGVCTALLVLGFLSSPVAPQPARAAEDVSLWYNLLGRSVSVSSLEAFAEDGTLDSTLASYLRQVDPETREEIRKALVASREIEPGELSQLLYTPMGRLMLEYAGQLIQTSSGQNGAGAIRGALVVAASQPEGLSLLSFLNSFPTQELRIDLTLGVELYREAEKAIDEINTFTEIVKQISEEEAAKVVVDFDSLPSLREPGPFSVSAQTIVLQDTARNRTYPADIYRPENVTDIEAEIPVMVISHGLGSSRAFFAEFAEHLASYGFVVAVPEHIGSNKAQQEAVIGWLDSELFKVSEFVDRPKDVSFLLDELERINISEFQGQLNLEKVGVVGHSYGGYTALMLGGATIDFDRVRQLCQFNTNIAVGLAILLTCRSLELQQSNPETIQLLTEGDLQDSRVGLVMAFNPVSNLFGESGMSRIQVPVVMVGGVDDFAAPILREQAEPFNWLTIPERYLIVAERISHNSELSTLINRLFYSVDESDQNIELAREETRANVKAIILAFSEFFVAGNEDFKPFLTSAYLESINQDPFDLHLVRSLPPNSLPSTLD